MNIIEEGSKIQRVGRNAVNFSEYVMATIHMNLSEIELPTGDLCKIKRIKNYSTDVGGTLRSLLPSEEGLSVDSLLGAGEEDILFCRHMAAGRFSIHLCVTLTFMHTQRQHLN